MNEESTAIANDRPEGIANQDVDEVATTPETEEAETEEETSQEGAEEVEATDDEGDDDVDDDSGSAVHAPSRPSTRIRTGRHHWDRRRRRRRHGRLDGPVLAAVFGRPPHR